jgi:hypothetical protein
MLKPESRETPSADALQSFSLVGAVAWALTRDKECAELADRDPGRCFRDGGIIFGGMYVAEPYYFDDAEAAWQRLRSEIAAGHVRTEPPDWRPTKDEDWRANRLVQIDFDDLQSALPLGGLRVFSSKLAGLSDLFKPADISLTTAALWIATQGDSVECNIADAEIWKPAFQALLEKVAEGSIELIGRKGGVGDPVKIERHVVLDVPIEYPYQEGFDFTFSERYLQCDAVGYRNDLISEWQLAWADLRVNRAQLLTHWPFGQGSGQEFYQMLEKPPQQAAAASAFRLLLWKYPDRNVPRVPIERLVRNLNAANRDPNARPINADAVKRALGLKK